MDFIRIISAMNTAGNNNQETTWQALSEKAFSLLPEIGASDEIVDSLGIYAGGFDFMPGPYDYDFQAKQSEVLALAAKVNAL